MNIAAVSSGSSSGGCCKSASMTPTIAGIGILPAVKNRAGQTALTLAHQKANARILLCNGGDDFGSAVATIIVHDQNLVVKVKRIEDGANTLEQRQECWPPRTMSEWPVPVSAESRGLPVPGGQEQSPRRVQPELD